MESLKGIVQIWPYELWKGARIIRIVSIPKTIQEGAMRSVLTLCMRENVSVELCFTQISEAFGALTAFLIFRNLSGYAYEVKDRLDRTVKLVCTTLSTSGIQHTVEDDDVSKSDALKPFFGGRMSRCSGVGFFPPEFAPNPGNVYGPGQYAAPRGTDIDVAGILDSMADYSNALFSLQFNVTSIFPGERIAISNQRQRLSTLGSNALAHQALMAYNQLEQTNGEGCYIVKLFCLGDPQFVESVAVKMQICQMRSYTLPPEITQKTEYVLFGDKWLNEAVVRYGHEPFWRDSLPKLLLRLTHITTLQGAVGIFNPAQMAGNIRGIRYSQSRTVEEPLPPAFANTDGILLGTHVASGQQVYISPESLTRHGMFVGKPGSGKTTFALGLLYRLQARPEQIPFLVIEPAKHEYRSLMERIPELRVYTPGRQDLSPMQLNPFLPPKGVTLDQYQSNLEAIFALAVSMTHPLDIIFPQVISRCYAQYGWRPDSTRDTEGVRIFGMHEFILAFRRYLHENYASDPEALHNLENGGVTRLMALMNTPLFDTNQSIDIDVLLETPTVVELDALGSGRQKALVMGILLTQIMVSLQQRQNRGNKLRNLILVDEAHLLLSQENTTQSGSANPSQAVVGLLQNLVLILRAYGTALLFGDQSPSRLTEVILNNVNLKVMLHLDSRRDREILGETAHMRREMLEDMATLPTGEAYMHCDAIRTPTRIITPNAEADLKLDKAMSDERVREHMNIELKPPFSQCIHCQRCDDKLRSDCRFIAEQIKGDLGELIQSHTKLARYLVDKLTQVDLNIAQRFHIDVVDVLTFHECVKIHLIRSILLDSRCNFSENDLLQDLESQSHHGKGFESRASDEFEQPQKDNSDLADLVRNFVNSGQVWKQGDVDG